MELSKITSLERVFSMLGLVYTKCKFLKWNLTVLPGNLFDFCHYIWFGVMVQFLQAKMWNLDQIETKCHNSGWKRSLQSHVLSILRKTPDAYYSTSSVGMEIDEMFLLPPKPLSLFSCNVLVVFEENKIHKRLNSSLAQSLRSCSLVLKLV